MFRRRHKLHPADWVLNLVWPRIGWRRSWAYWLHRMERLPGSDYSLSVGFAFGAAMSFTPFVGFHFVLAALSAWLCRANILASAIGTAVGNPWTFPFIWIWIYNLGIWMGFESEGGSAAQMDFASFFGNLLKSFLRFDLTYLADTAWPIFGPMLLGSLPTAIVAWLAFFLTWRWTITAYRRGRLRRLAARREPKIKQSGQIMGGEGDGTLSTPRR
jgi:uncharacterized protein (DUF2062 family)